MQKISWWRTSIGQEEINRIVDSISKEYISQGPMVSQLEDDLARALDVPYVVVTTSGSVALLLACMALDIGPGDEVIVPDRTWIATAHAPLILGAKVVLADVLHNIPVIDVFQINKHITSRTKAIMPVHLNGRACDMEEINKLAGDHGISVIEDAAQAMFSKNSNGFLGAQSDIGCFSLGLAKFMSTGQGGFAVTRNKKLYEKLILVRNHGLTNNFHPTFLQIGCNFRFNDILASVGIEQLKKKDAKASRINKIYAKYEKEIKKLPFIKIIPVNVSNGEIPLYIEALCNERDKFMKFMESKGIDCRPALPNVHEAPHIESSGDFPKAEVFSKKGLVLPCGPDQPLENIDRVIETIHSYNQ